MLSFRFILREKKLNFIFLFFIACGTIALFLFLHKTRVYASTPAYTLSTTKTSAESGDTIPVTINMDTGGNDVVVSKVIIRYNKNLVNVSTSDIDLTNSVFAATKGGQPNNSCLFPNDYSDAALRNQPCEIISNDAANGILSITLAMPSYTASTQPGTQINSANALVATINFHSIASISNSLSTMGIQFAGTGNYNDSDMIKDTPTLDATDPNAGADLLASVDAASRSTVTYGDLNSDRKVSLLDYNILLSNYGDTTSGNVADITSDSKVNLFDYNTLLGNFGRTDL